MRQAEGARRGRRAGLAAADEVRWRQDAPARYTVKNGDTLWDIAGQFLHSPWRWPRVWQQNPQIDNPHLIYPGDRITLRDCDGRPCLDLERGQNVVKMSPEMRALPRRQVVPPLPMSVLQAFLREHRVVDTPQELEALAYVVGTENKRLISGAGDQVFVRPVEASASAGLERGQRLGIFRQGEVYRDAAGEPLGLELIGIGEGVLADKSADMMRMNVQKSAREVRSNDIILPLETRLAAAEMEPRAPRRDVAGHIVGVPGGVRFIGRLQVVAIDLGTEDGIQPGHVLSIEQRGERVVDPRTDKAVRLPGEVAGTLVVFRPYDRVSYAIVMEATNTLAVGDAVHPPR
ncbi:LysM peptidoglycan-binding domain-containing protein [Halomonas piscis]|uniref:LysM peptidoglycan-binding domain-containing protein n=1 Tax=Halomonas piscis TaxID=3031727 RepID=UPI0028A1B96B|nr:LysM domain-containing protein [Halomonas piscis]